MEDEKMTVKAQRINILLALLALVAVIAVIAVVGYFTMREGPEIIQGQAEVTTYRVSSKIPARVKELRVEEGQQVHAGDTLVILEAPDIEAKKMQALAARDAAEAQNQKAIHGARSEQIQGAYEVWQKAKAGLTVAEKSYQRVKKLYDEGVLPAQKNDEAKAQYDAMSATEKAAHSQYQLALAGARKEDKEAAAALVNEANGAVSEVESYVDESILVAQTDGEVDEIYPQVGELVGSGAPIMTIDETGKMWVTFNIREDLLNDMTQGTVIEAKVPALNNQEFKFKIYYMRDLGTYAAWKATKTKGQYDMKTFEVRARPVKPIAHLEPGMSVIFDKKVK